MRRPPSIRILGSCLLAFAAACSLADAPQAEPSPEAPTLAEATAEGPALEEPTRTPQPGFTLIPPTFDPAVPPTRVPCVDDAQFVTDLTVPDFSQFLPGAPLDKRWLIRNTGTCEWGPDYRVAFAEGSSMGAQLEHALYPARPGAEAIVQIPMVAPDIPGDYQGDWQLRDPANVAFGPILFIKINVIAVPEGNAPGD